MAFVDPWGLAPDAHDRTRAKEIRAEIDRRGEISREEAFEIAGVSAGWTDADLRSMTEDEIADLLDRYASGSAQSPDEFYEVFYWYAGGKLLGFGIKICSKIVQACRGASSAERAAQETIEAAERARKANEARLAQIMRARKALRLQDVEKEIEVAKSAVRAQERAIEEILTKPGPLRELAKSQLERLRAILAEKQAEWARLMEELLK